jgi:hypothetical protein
VVPLNPNDQKVTENKIELEPIVVNKKNDGDTSSDKDEYYSFSDCSVKSCQFTIMEDRSTDPNIVKKG